MFGQVCLHRWEVGMRKGTPQGMLKARKEGTQERCYSETYCLAVFKFSINTETRRCGRQPRSWPGAVREASNSGVRHSSFGLLA